MVWASASTWSTPGITGSPGKWPWKNHSVAVTALIPTIRCASGSYSTIRSTRRNGQRCGMSPSISRVVCTTLVVEAAPAVVASAVESGDTAVTGVVAVVVSVTGSSRTSSVQSGKWRPSRAWRRMQGCTPETIRHGFRRRGRRRCRPDREDWWSFGPRGRPRSRASPGGSARSFRRPR